MTQTNVSNDTQASSDTQSIVLGGGCFWCVEAVFVELDGIVSVEPGYAGGHVLNPTYEQICEANTGHIEVARVTYDPRRLSLDDIFNVFFGTHDPTTVDRQGNDVGPQYASAIFWATPTQRDAAQAFLDKLRDERTFAAPVVTKLLPLEKFWPAEDYHRDYFARHPTQGYCQFVIAPKVAKMRQKFADKLSSGKG